MLSATPAILGLHHIKIPVSSLARSLEFYTSIVGARHLTKFSHYDHSGNLYAHIVEMSPSTPSSPPILIELRLDPDHAAKLRGFNVLTFSVSTERHIDEWASWCTARNVENSGKLRGLLGYVLAMEDPDGMRVRMYSSEVPEGGMDPSLVSKDPRWLD